MSEFRDNAEHCQQCDTDLQGAPIPSDKQHLYGATHLSRRIGIYDIERDRTVAWMCPDCGHRWERK